MFWQFSQCLHKVVQVPFRLTRHLYIYQVTKGHTQPKDMINAAQNPYSYMVSVNK